MFWGNWSTTSQFLTINGIIKGVHPKFLKVRLLFVDFSKAFDSIHKRKMELFLLAYGLFKETVTTIIMFYKNMKVMVSSPDGDTNFFDVVGVFQGETLALYIFIICLNYIRGISIDLMKENIITLKDKKQTIFCRNPDRCRLSSTSHRYAYSSQIPAA